MEKILKIQKKKLKNKNFKHTYKTKFFPHSLIFLFVYMKEILFVWDGVMLCCLLFSLNTQLINCFFF